VSINAAPAATQRRSTFARLRPITPLPIVRWGIFMLKNLAAAAVIMLAVCVTPLVADAAKAPASSASLRTSLDGTYSAPYGTPYVVSGCGYNGANGGVTVVVQSPSATAFAGQVPIEGCISLTNFSTQGPGMYKVTAWQHVRNRDVVVASTSFTLH
jgi:hypothetical protein